VEISKEDPKVQVTIEERMTIAIRGIGCKPKIGTLIYYRSLNLVELIHWIGEMEKYFELEQIKNPMRIMFACTRLKSHVYLWWDKLQFEREYEGKKRFETSKAMLAKLKIKFLPIDYALNLLRWHNLKQVKMTVKEYVDEFYKVSIMSRV